MTNDERDAAIALLDQVVQQLREHFDAVQILVTWAEDAHTADLFKGAGNWYARVGMAREFLQRDVAQVDADEIAKRIKPEDED